MARKNKQIITMKEEDMNVKDILRNENSSPEELIAAQVILEDQIESLKAAATIVEDKIKGKRFDDVVKDMESRGVIYTHSWQETSPIVEITTKYGDVITVTISKGEDTGFAIDKKLSDKSTIDSIVPDRYKKVSTLLDKKMIEADFEAGTLPAVLKAYCSKNPTEFLKTRKSVKKS